MREAKVARAFFRDHSEAQVAWASAGATEQKEQKTRWPDPPAKEAFHGLAGDIVREIEPHSEADPVAILVQILTAFGNVIGGGPHFRVEADRHALNLFAVLVGVTAKSRKGTSKGQALRPFETADRDWCATRVLSGLSSGEGLIWAVRDKITRREAVRQKGRVVDYQDIEVDLGVSDKRLLVFEPEFASVLKMLVREGNTLSTQIRQAWDCGNLRTLTKNSPAVATGAHISIIGHVTRDELLRYLDATEQANGFANRFLWLCARRSKYLPDSEDREVDPAKMGTLSARMREAVAFAREVGEIKRDDQARAAWREIYAALSAPQPGMLGAVLARAEAQVMRLSCNYALLDKSATMGLEHLKAALALWEYCERSARFIFGDALGDPTADTILTALRANSGGLTWTEISGLLGRNKPASQIDRALDVLASLGLATFQREETDGRATERWIAL
jgi:hypothetical protein